MNKRYKFVHILALREAFIVECSLFQALSLWGRSKKRADDERDQRPAGSRREKEQADGLQRYLKC